MKRKKLNKYSSAAIMLVAVAVILVTIAVRTNLGEFVTATFVLSGMICIMTAIFFLTFSRGDPIDPRLVGILPAQNCVNLCRIASDLCITGNAYFLPPRSTGETRVMQFNPKQSYDGSTIFARRSFPETGPQGLVTIPSCDPLIQDLRKRNALVIPNKEENLTQLLRETIGEIFEFAPRVTVLWSTNRVTITFHHYRFIEGCEIIALQSPGCCTRNPCPMCSLCGALIAEGTDKVVSLEKCSVSSSNQDVIMVCSIIS